MNILPKLGLALGKTLIVFSITLAVVGFLFISSLGQPNKIKSWLRDSGLYSALADSIQKQFIEGTESLEQVPPELVEKAIRQTFDEQRAQEFVESSVDGTYAWLNRDKDSVSIELNTNELQDTFVSNVGANLRERLQSLPRCPQGVFPRDILNANCVPAGLDISRVVNETTAQFARNQLSNPEELQQQDGTSSPGEIQPVNFAEQIKPVRDFYQWALLLPYIALGIFVVGGALVIWLSKPRYRSLRTLATAAIPYGAIYIIAGLLLPNFLIAATTTGIESIEDPSFHGPLKSVAEDLSNNLGNDLLRIGGIILAVGTILLVTYVVVKKKNPPREAPAENKPSVPEPPNTPEHTTK